MIRGTEKKKRREKKKKLFDVLLVRLRVSLLEDEIIAGEALVDVADIGRDTLEVRGGVVRLGNKDVASGAIVFGLPEVGHVRDPL